MPTNSATAGMTATPSIQRHTCGSLISASSTAFIANARNCPVTIMSSLIVTIRPRRCAGAISARYSGQVVAAAPTPKPRMIRPAVMIPTLGAIAQMRAPTRNSPAQTSRLPLRPRLSASLPPSSAPKAAPGNSRELTTSASVKGVSMRSSFMYNRAPEMTPVSYPKSSPPRVDMTVSLMRNRLCAGDMLAGWHCSATMASVS